jgi:hypothetical protein
MSNIRQFQNLVSDEIAAALAAGALQLPEEKHNCCGKGYMSYLKKKMIRKLKQYCPDLSFECDIEIERSTIRAMCDGVCWSTLAQDKDGQTLIVTASATMTEIAYWGMAEPRRSGNTLYVSSSFDREKVLQSIENQRMIDNYLEKLEALENFIDNPLNYIEEDLKKEARKIIEELREFFMEEIDRAADAKWRE